MQLAGGVLAQWRAGLKIKVSAVGARVLRLCLKPGVAREVAESLSQAGHRELSSDGLVAKGRRAAGQA